MHAAGAHTHVNRGRKDLEATNEASRAESFDLQPAVPGSASRTAHNTIATLT